MSDWTFFSNYGHVLVCLSRDHESRLRDVATQVGITERAVQKIVKDLQDAGYLEISKHGRRNRYRINNRKALRHAVQSGCTVGQMLSLFDKPQPAPPANAELEVKNKTPVPQARPATPPPADPARDQAEGETNRGDQGQLF